MWLFLHITIISLNNCPPDINAINLIDFQTLMHKHSLKLVIDARPLSRNIGGMTRYLEKILPYLLENNDLDIVLYTDQSIPEKYIWHDSKTTIRCISNHKISKFLWHIIVPIWLYIDKPDLYWSPRQHLPVFMPKSIKSIVTIHDLVWKTFPQTIPRLQRLSEQTFMGFSVKKANLVLCISNATQSLLNEHFPAAKEKSHVIRHGLDINRSKKIETTSRGSYILAVGTIEPRKNYRNLIKGFEKYAKNNKLDLIIVGKQGWLYEESILTYNNSDYKHRITLLNNVSDNELTALYSQAAAFISPSLDEGYGLPALEATANGIPLLLSNIEVYKELYPYAFDFFDPSSPTDIARSMLTMEANVKQFYSVDLSKQPNWDECANTHIKLIIQQVKNANRG